MAKYMLCLLLLSGILVVQVMAERSGISVRNPPKLRVGRAMLEAHKAEESIADPPAEAKSPSSEAESEKEPAAEEAAEAPESRKMGKHEHSSDVAGGGVIIGGLVTAIFAAVYCYIRVTRKRNVENH